MRTHKTIANQSLLDLSIMSYGTLEGLFELSLLNGLAVTDDVATGSPVEVADFDGKLISVVDFIEKNNIRPATGFTAVPIVEPLSGIGYWAIGVDFVVQ